MPFPKSVKDRAAVACNRSCCICHRFKGTKLEFHHIKQEANGGENTFENCIPLCLDCHADMGGINPKHPKGNAYSEHELILHRDKWYKQCEISSSCIASMSNVECEMPSEDAIDTFAGNSSQEIVLNYQSAEMSGRFTFDYSNNDGRYMIGSGEYSFVTMWSKASDRSIHAYKDSLGADGAIARVKKSKGWPDVVDNHCDFSSRVRTPEIGDVVIWKNSNGRYAATKILAIKDDTRGADCDELTCEYVIYCI